MGRGAVWGVIGAELLTLWLRLARSRGWSSLDLTSAVMSKLRCSRAQAEALHLCGGAVLGVAYTSVLRGTGRAAPWWGAALALAEGTTTMLVLQSTPGWAPLAGYAAFGALLGKQAER